MPPFNYDPPAPLPEIPLMNRFLLHLSCLCALNALPANLPAEEKAGLPFDPERIRRLSLDGVPRSLSIRQGKSVWLGYDLERAAIMKIWRAPEGKPGLIVPDFTTRSSGETLRKGPAKEERWRWSRDGKTVEPAIRYLGCTQGGGHFLLSWELKDGESILTLREKVPFEPDKDKVTRQLAVEGLGEGEELHPPGLGEGWYPDATILTGAGWHSFVLQP